LKKMKRLIQKLAPGTRLHRPVIWLGLALFLNGCSSNPIERIKRDLDQYPEYSITLQDMNREGNFFFDHYHQYKIVYGQATEGTEDLSYFDQILDWEKVDEQLYEKYRSFLGMVLVSKGRDGKVADVQYPPGYQYVGDDRYGRWRTGSGGRSFWEFYGQYAFMSHMFSAFQRPIYRTDWDSYNDYRSRGRPYYGTNNQYGTKGEYTRTANPTFFQRQQARAQARQQSFSQKVQQRAGRSSMSSTRSRSSSRSGGK